MKVKLLISALMLAISTTVSAQFVQSGGTSSRVTTSGSYSNYNRIFASYSPIKFSYDGDSYDDSYGGFQVGWLGGYNVVKNIPLYVEVGANVQANFHTEEGYKYDYKYTFVSLNVPVNITYRFTFPNTKISIAPYAGLRLKGNIIAQAKYDDETYSYFDKDDVDDTAKRIQLGYQVGVGVTFSQFYLGIGYAGDLTDFAKKTKSAGLVASVGVEF